MITLLNWRVFYFWQTLSMLAAEYTLPLPLFYSDFPVAHGKKISEILLPISSTSPSEYDAHLVVCFANSVKLLDMSWILNCYSPAIGALAITKKDLQSPCSINWIECLDLFSHISTYDRESWEVTVFLCMFILLSSEFLSTIPSHDGSLTWAASSSRLSSFVFATLSQKSEAENILENQKLHLVVPLKPEEKKQNKTMVSKRKRTLSTLTLEKALLEESANLYFSWGKSISYF